ncbi:hypothetical protein ACJW30_10G032400 [Castanea mollissima]
MASSSSSFPSSFSISSTSQWKYDVFLSFRGVDTRNTATDFLNYALEQRGIYTFKDDEKLEKGKTIKPELLKVIEESRFAVVILSKNYASSTWCLEELVKIIDCKKEKGMTVVPIFYNVDPSDVRKQKGTFTQAFVEHEKQFKEKVGTWRAALSHVANIAGYHVNNSPLSEVVQSIVGLISHKSSCEFSEVTEGLVGINSQVVELESYLALWLDNEVRFIGIWAMGGMGKSTLASVVYRMVSKEFEDCCFIDNVRKKDVLSLQKDLISQILHETNLIKNKYDGVHIIKKMLRHKKVLIVLDDVDESNELKMLVRKNDWFASGSRIIITTRDKHLLKEFPVDEIFEVKALNYEDALCLFCSKAFKKELCPYKYLELSKSFLEYVNGLPLAIEVLGSFLFGRSIAEWKNALEMLKEDPNPEINQILKISFDGLPNSVKDIFKDIACLFNHEKKDHVLQMLDSLGRYSHIGLSILIDKSLLKIFKNNKLWMHDLLRDMGRDLVRQESRDEPGKRSRLWLYDDVDHVLKNNTGTEAVQAIDIWEAKDTSIYQEEKEARWLGFTSSKRQKVSLWNPNAFFKMPKLKFLRIRSVCPQFVPEYLPNKLAYLEWSNYPSKSLLHFLPDELVQLRLQCSKIELLWGGIKNFDKLRFIDMAGSSNLIIASDFNGVPNLEELVLTGCSNLCELHPSIVKLKKLKLLDLEECQELTSLPDKFEMESLVTLNLSCCSKVKKIPEFVGNMKLVQRLLLKCIAITTLPSSIECLTGLNTLILRDCKQLVCLPNTICSLTLLKNLDLSGCSKFDKLPEDLGNIVSLEELYLSETAIKELPLSFEFLIGLTSLDLTNCKDFVLLPNTMCSLKSLFIINLSGCSKFVNLPENLGNLEGLFSLSLKGTAIEVLPSSVGCLTYLGHLDIRDCKNLLCLPSSICSLKMLKDLYLSGCSKLVNLPENLGNLEGLFYLSLNGTAIEVLLSSVGRLTALRQLSLSDCKNLLCLPSSICNLKMLKHLYLSGCSKFVNLPKNLENLENLCLLSLKGAAIEVLPSSVGRLTALRHLNLSDCKNLLCLPSSICSLKMLKHLHLSGCSKFVNLPEHLGNLKSLVELSLKGTAIEALPSSVRCLTALESLDIRNCKNLVCLPHNIGCLFSLRELHLWRNNFVSLPESISQLSRITRLNLYGCKRLRSLPDIPSQVDYINVNNCTSLERFPESPKNCPRWCLHCAFCVSCVNCFNIQFCVKVLSGKLVGRLPYILPGKEIPNGFEEANIRDSSIVAFPSFHRRDYSVNIQLPRSGFDELRAILLCVVLVPCEHYNHPYKITIEIKSIKVDGIWYKRFASIESHHLALSLHYLNFFDLENPGWSIDEKGFHEVEFTIATRYVEVETVGFRLLNKQDIKSKTRMIGRNTGMMRHGHRL